MTRARPSRCPRAARSRAGRAANADHRGGAATPAAAAASRRRTAEARGSWTRAVARVPSPTGALRSRCRRGAAPATTTTALSTVWRPQDAISPDADATASARAASRPRGELACEPSSRSSRRTRRLPSTGAACGRSTRRAATPRPPIHSDHVIRLAEVCPSRCSPTALADLGVRQLLAAVHVADDVAPDDEAIAQREAQRPPDRDPRPRSDRAAPVGCEGDPARRATRPRPPGARVRASRIVSANRRVSPGEAPAAEREQHGLGVRWELLGDLWERASGAPRSRPRRHRRGRTRRCRPALEQQPVCVLGGESCSTGPERRPR